MCYQKNPRLLAWLQTNDRTQLLSKTSNQKHYKIITIHKTKTNKNKNILKTIIGNKL